MKCPNCGHQSDRFEGTCPECGERLTRGKRKKKRKGLLAGTVAALFILTGGTFAALQFWGDEEAAEEPVAPEEEILPESDEADLIEEEEQPEEAEEADEESTGEESEEPVVREGTVERAIQEDNAVAQEAIILPEKIAGQERDAQQIIKDSLPKVFTILTDENIGSGFLYKSGGLIATNAHVVSGYTDVTVRNSDGKESQGRVVGISDRSDVALIKVDDYANIEPFQVETGVTPIGAEVIAIGSPHGLSNTVTTGTLTAHDQNLELGFIYENIYQINARIERGNSGGPLIDAKTGKVVGINSLVMQDNSLVGFAIPLYSMTGLLDQWAASPMSPEQVAGVFGTYDEFEGGAASPEDDQFEGGWEGETFNEIALENFILRVGHFQTLMKDAGDFFWLADLVEPGSPAYDKLTKEANELAGSGIKYELLGQDVTSVEIYDDHAIVHSSETEKTTAADGTVTENNVNRDYKVIIDSNGFFQVSDVTVAE
ncbi:Putative serine protease HtrA [Bhargavaea cecembensis DSE10]|uniref:Putative serine protease HtrA n=1 Tax=Bhargavaea cecembensis DSE10 TaxID=1235279 RepID=M7NE43_9BACL|nr:trypsin-like peptidase domain-containing protein [Bhargavaea cecembensis]EMR06808.1 Putative serine protease HtrA [Bhargavaea cecembensis DSE10]